ncbi:MAG: hypothetical protein FJ320_09450 [SAR202 cluster bacterium]|nr:hypothetical protein [SAR202 cluster bacterium]
MLNVGRLDTATGSYTIDFYLSFSCDQPCSPGLFEFSNGRATSIDKSVDEPTEKFYRIQAALNTSLDLADYPFDRHKLIIKLEDKEQTSQTQAYEVSLADSGLDPAVDVVGWAIDGWSASVDDHYYEPYGTSFSQYSFAIEIHRSRLAAVLKSFLPALVIVFVGMLALVLSPDKIIPRLTLTTGSFTSAVLFHLNLTSSIPPVGYLTFADRFMIFNYVTLAMVLASTLMALYYVDKKRPEAAQRVHHAALAAVPLVWLMLHALNFLLL